MQENPRSRKDEIPVDPEKNTGDLVLERTRYLKRMKPVETSDDWGHHWQRPAKGARPGYLYSWFVEVEIYGKRGVNLFPPSVVVDLGLATLAEINDSKFFWGRFSEAMHHFLDWRDIFDEPPEMRVGVGLAWGDHYFQETGEVKRTHKYLKIEADEAPSAQEVHKLVIVRRFRHKEEQFVKTKGGRGKPGPKKRVPFSERKRIHRRGHGRRPPE